MNKYAKDAARYKGLLGLLKKHNIHLHYYDRSHEIAGPTFVISDANNGEVLGYGPSTDEAVDAAIFTRVPQDD